MIIPTFGAILPTDCYDTQRLSDSHNHGFRQQLTHPPPRYTPQLLRHLFVIVPLMVTLPTTSCLQAPLTTPLA